jgi:ABC-type transport system involved in multi-copper enzyme maturation permease subunit
VSASIARVGAVIRKELAEFRRNRLIVTTAGVLPVAFLIAPTISILNIRASALDATLNSRIEYSLFLPLLVPVFVPSIMSAYSVVGEREQGTLEAVLTTPVGRAELLLGKAAAIFMPAAALGYLIWGIWVGLAISTRVSDTRVSQQLSVLASLPAVALAALMQFQVISPTFGLVAALAGGLLAFDCAAGLVVARLFDRERLITGSRPSGGITQRPLPLVRE